MPGNRRVVLSRKGLITFTLSILVALMTVLTVNTLVWYGHLPYQASALVTCGLLLCYILAAVLIIRYLVSLKVEKYKGLTEREVELYEENQVLRDTNNVLTQFAGFRLKTWPRMIFWVCSVMLMAVIYATFVFIVDGTFAIATPVRIGIFLVTSILLGTGFLCGFAYMIYGKKHITFCLNCDRIRVGKVWKHLIDFGNFSHGLCDVCARALMDKHTEEEKKK